MRTYFGTYINIWTAVCLVAWGAGGCNSEDEPPSGLDGREFLLESAEGAELLEGATVHLNFEDGGFAITAGCDYRAGDFSLREGRLIVGDLRSSPLDVICGGARYAQNEWLGMFVSSSPHLLLDGDQLTLTGDDATLRFLDREVADPDRPLVGTLWTVGSLLDADSVGSVLNPAPTLLFDDDGTLQVSTRCNTGGGRYTVSGSSITTSDVVHTEVDCNDERTEAHIAAVIGNGSLTFQIEAATLTLQRGDVGVMAGGAP